MTATKTKPTAGAIRRLAQIEARIEQEIDLLDELGRSPAMTPDAAVAQAEILREIAGRLRVEHCLMGGVRRVLEIGAK